MTARWKLAGALGALASAAVLAPAGAGAASLPAGSTAILSGTPDLLSAFAAPANNSDLRPNAVSRDGTRVVFSSTADGLSAEDDDTVENVYVKDMTTGAVQLVSRLSGARGEPAHVDCTDGAISPDGRAVAFTCGGRLDPTEAQHLSDVYVRDLDTQQTTMVSRVPGEDQTFNTDDGSTHPAITVSGGTTFVAFQSNSTTLLGGAPLTEDQRIYRATLTGGAVTSVALASQNGNPAAATSFAEDPSISDDGSRVAFDTGDALDAADTGSDSDIYVRDFRTGTTIFASRRDGAGGAEAAGSAEGPAISGDGTAVAFATSQSLDPAHDLSFDADVYLRSLSAGRTTLVSPTPAGTAAGGAFSGVSIDASGSTVAFVAKANNQTADSPQNLESAYVFRAGTGVRLVGRVGVAGPAAFVAVVALSGDGTQIALRGVGLTPELDPRFATVVLRDVASGASRAVSRSPGAAPFVNAGGFETGGSLSADGRFAAFLSEAPALGAPNGVYVRDLATGAVTLASRADGANGAPLDETEQGPPAISADGQRVAFESGGQVFVRDLAVGRTFEVSVADGAGGVAGDRRSEDPSISEDGSRVAFSSRATNLTASDRDTITDVFVRDLAAGRTVLADVVSGTGAKGGGGASAPAISGDGRSVAFTTNARLDPALDTGGENNVFVHRLDSGATVLASVAGAATVGSGGSTDASIDRDGNRVSFLSNSPEFGGPGGTQALYVRDLAAQTLTIAGRADGPAGTPPQDPSPGLLSADGEHVAFLARTSTSHTLPSVAPGDLPDGVTRVYERDLATGVTRLISRQSGVDGAASGAGTETPGLDGITADGGCVAFDMQAPLLPGQLYSDFGNVYVRTVSSNCGRPDPNPPGQVTVPGPGGGGTPAAVLSKLALKPARFHVGGRKAGTKISFRLDRAASVTLAFDRLLPGRRAKAKKVHGRKGKLGPCSTKRRHGGVRCTVVKRFGRLVLAQSRLHAGANAVKFSGRIGRKALAPGRYRLTATPLHGKARTVTFTVVKAPKRKPASRKR